MLASLPKLPTGEGWVWSPEADILARTTFPIIQTFDSSNPKNLHRSNVKLSTIDVPTIRTKLELAAGEIVNDDPVQLKRLLAGARAELQRLAAKPAVSPDSESLARAREAGRNDVRMALVAACKTLDHIRTLASEIGQRVSEANTTLANCGAVCMEPVKPHSPTAAIRTVTADERRKHESSQRIISTESAMGSDLKTPERRLLTVLAQRRSGVELERLAILAGYTVNGHFNNTLGNLRSKEYLSAARVTPIVITDAGLRALGSFDPLPTGKNLQEYWLSRLSAPEQKILRVLLQEYPQPIELDALARAAGYTINGHFNNIIGSLRGKGLMTPARIPILAASDFFE